MQIEYRAGTDQRAIRASTAKEAVALFLATFKNRTFSVQEYRDGVFRFSIRRPSPDACFYKQFKSRAEAQAFCQGS